MCDIREVLQSARFGERVAEEERTELERYFVETDQWNRLYGGEIDVVYGAKGTGKSALYSLLMGRKDSLKRRRILVTSAEVPRGTPVFQSISEDPPTSEQEFVALWTLYIATLIHAELAKLADSSPETRKLAEILGDAGLIYDAESDLSGQLRRVFRFVKGWFRRPQSMGVEIKTDPTTGAPVGWGGSISFGEPDDSGQTVPVDRLLAIANKALDKLDMDLWVLLDRLDVAFAENPDLEVHALRALFRLYLGTSHLERISPKIFLRSDIWERIVDNGFREASHITRHLTIEWGTNSLLNLVIRRAVNNSSICEFYRVDGDSTLRSFKEQETLFYSMFPDQVDVGEKKPKTFDWIIGRIRDGSRKAAPRELIHFLNCAREKRLSEYIVGEAGDDKRRLFTKSSLKDAVPIVSKVRLEQTLYAEYPHLKNRIRAMEGAKTQQNISSLSELWNVSEEEALDIAYQLVAVGFFEKRGLQLATTFWVPFLYRDAAKMVQGTAYS